MPFLDNRYLTQSIPPAVHDREFVLGYLRALGASAEWVADALLRAELTRDQLCEFEGRPARTWYAQQNLPELATLYLWLHDGAPPADERAEAGTKDSWRFDLMRRSVSRIGAVTRLRMVPSRPHDSVLYTPVICFGFQVSLQCAQRMERPVVVGVDLTTGASGEHLAGRILTSRLDMVHVPPAQVRRRELRFKHAFEIACEWVKEHVARDETTWQWYHSASHRFRRELEQVELYFGQRAREGEPTAWEAERKQAVEEVRRRFMPRVDARAQVAALVYCPADEIS